MTIQEALKDMEIAFWQLEFAIKLLSFCELGGINPSDFDTDHTVSLGSESLHFPRGRFSELDNILKAAGTSVLAAFSVSVLVLDDAFQAAGMKPDPEASENDGQLRTLIYMARCAYAHGIATPRWQVRGKYCRRLSVSLDGELISLDLPALHGQDFVVDQLVDYASWYRIRDASLRLLRRVGTRLDPST
jgi:hypothetical protein